MKKAKSKKKAHVHHHQSKEQSGQFDFVKSPWFYLGIILVVTYFSFQPLFEGEFSNWDDTRVLTHNPLITNLSLDNVINSATKIKGVSIGAYLTWATEYNLYGMDANMFHQHNVYLHLINTVLVFWMIFGFSKNLMASTITAAVFALHPMHVEAVGWITGRSWLLCTLFYLLSLICYYKYVFHDKKILFYTLSIIFFAFSIVSQGAGITLAPTLFLIDYLKERKISKQLFLEKIPYFILMILIVKVLMSARYGEQDYIVTYTLIERFFIASYSFIFHIYKLIIPTDLSPFYPLIQKVDGNLPGWLYIYLPIALLLGGLAIYFSKKSRLILFGFGFYLITIGPVLRLIPVDSPYLMADRYTYLSHLGLLFPISIGLAHIYQNKNQYSRLVRSLVLIVILVFGIGMPVWSWERCGIWKDSVSMWTDVLDKYPEEKVAYSNRSLAYGESGNLKLALKDCNKTIELDPTSTRYYNNRGLIYNNLGQYDLAIVDFNKGLEIDPEYFKFYFNRGISYSKKGDLNQTIKDYTKAIELDSNYVEAFMNRGIVYTDKAGKYDLAIQDFTKVIALQPDNMDAKMNMGLAYYKKGDNLNAVTNYTDALAEAPDNSKLHYLRSLANFGLERYIEAYQDATKAQYLGYNVEKSYLDQLKGLAGTI
ncbi:MAG: tetratricopeptide repeat protein [Bacteroidia bacterium]|nr:tetratricopeptide repeat protein [Bacteroidia bacterium]